MSSKSEDNAEVEVDKKIEGPTTDLVQTATSTGETDNSLNLVQKTLDQIDREYQDIIKEEDDQGVDSVSEIPEGEEDKYGL